ncbi:hypothetical protein KIN20_028069 [Parelaphostrongylus tenuis]|uniref:Uncharacterized protein n=1 Tax=Parelaphostrongylus tenuis TaxID=148309 RepID=A0AAD5WEC2_PARTN|nr:hypothetical protein KIN20_028069 [Parelaphostrongylus tenuis]
MGEANMSTAESNDEDTAGTATEPPAVEESTILKAADDKSVCQIRPSEGRTCREDEQITANKSTLLLFAQGSSMQTVLLPWLWW